jgi:putative ABC transport system substrate-binding protein
LKRRALLALLAGAAADLAAPRRLAAQTGARLGYLSGGRREDNAENTIGVLRDSLREHGWRLGETLAIEERWASGDASLMPRLARELVAQKPDILVSTGTTETRALHELTKTIPIVFMQLAVDPVAVGLVQRISRPGGNVTGFMQWPQLLWGKRLELLTELLGRPPRRLAGMGNPRNASSPGGWADARDAASRIGSDIVRVDVNGAGDFDRAFETVAKGRDALLVQFDFLFAVERRRVAALAVRHRLPAIYENRMQALGGGLMSYGGDLRENYRQGATYVHRVLNGTPVGQLPVVQASRFELVINVPAARAIGLTVPERLLARAAELIES